MPWPGSLGGAELPEELPLNEPELPEAVEPSLPRATGALLDEEEELELLDELLDDELLEPLLLVWPAEEDEPLADAEPPEDEPPEDDEPEPLWVEPEDGRDATVLPPPALDDADFVVPVAAEPEPEPEDEPPDEEPPDDDADGCDLPVDEAAEVVVGEDDTTGREATGAVVLTVALVVVRPTEPLPPELRALRWRTVAAAW